MFRHSLMVYFQLFNSLSCFKMHIIFLPIIRYFTMEVFLGLNSCPIQFVLSSMIIDSKYRLRSSVSNLMHNFFKVFSKFFLTFLWCLEPCLSFYILFIFIVIFQASSSSHAFLKFSNITHVMPCCTLYMTFNYLKSFFIIKEMKCKFAILLLSNSSKCDT